MGGKKKNLANRLAKLSEEDRQRYLQHKADQEEELRRRKEQLINTFLKNKIKKEDAFARLNVAKLNENWHQLLRKMKCSEMKEEVSFMKEYVDRVLAHKNRTIEKLLTELQESEEQYANNLQSHLNYINKTIDFSRQALEDMHQEFLEEIATRIAESREEHAEIADAAKEQELHLKTFRFQFGEESKREIRELRDHYFKIADSVIQKNTNEFKEMRTAKEKQITQLWLEIGRYIKDYVEKTDVRRAHLAELHALDAQNATEIQTNEEQLMQSQVALDNLEQSFASMQTTTSAEIRRLEEYLARLKSDFLKQKNATFRSFADDDHNMKLLTDTSNAVIQRLQKHCTEGEKLLQLSLICRKFETEEEIATRFASVSALDEQQLQFARVPDSTLNDELDTWDSNMATEQFARIRQMENFWRYHSRVVIGLMEMRRQKAALAQDNRLLKEDIRRAMEVRVDETLDERLLRNQRQMEKSLFVVCSSATGVRY